jgi:uncharacterized protein (DUF1697 family)
MLKVAFLRGVNVGSVRVPMADLRALFERLGFAGARTVLNTGNVIFESEQPDGPLIRTVEAELTKAFSYEAVVFVRDAESMAALAASCPFEERDGHHRFAVICANDDVAARLAHHPLELADDEARSLGDGVVYWSVPRGSTLDSPFGKALASREFSPHVTNRNLNTITRIAALATE